MNSTSADEANTADPTRVDAVGESTTSTMPAASVSGATAACSQPRRCGLTSCSFSRTCPPTRLAAGTPDEIRGNLDVAAAYLGETAVPADG